MQKIEVSWTVILVSSLLCGIYSFLIGQLGYPRWMQLWLILLGVYLISCTVVFVSFWFKGEK